MIDMASPHNIMLNAVSADVYETAYRAVEPVLVRDFGFLANEASPPTDDFGRPVYWLYVIIGSNHYKSTYRMSEEEFLNIRIWQFMKQPPASAIGTRKTPARRRA
jgi:hypothetical protein